MKQWDGVSWTALGSAANGSVSTLSVISNGWVVAGGGFSSIGGVNAENLALWNGSGWTELGGGVNSSVRSTAYDSSNNLIYVGGFFSAAGGIASTSNIAAYDLQSNTWQSLSSNTIGTVQSLSVSGSGDRVLVGSSAGVWLKSNGALVKLGDVNDFTGSASVAISPAGDLYASRSTGPGTPNLYYWDGAEWQSNAFGDGLDESPQVLKVKQDGTLIAGGGFHTAGGKGSHGFALWVPPLIPEYYCNGLLVNVNLQDGEIPTSEDDVIQGTSGNDDIRGKAGNDTICGMGGDDFIHGNSGDDWIHGGDGVDNLRGGRGNDIIYTGLGATVGTSSRAFGGYDDDLIFGGPDADDLRGGRGNDMMYGDHGEDEITGNNDDDIIYGQSGNDVLNGGSGENDELYGGDDSDSLNGGGGANDLCDAGNALGDTQTNCEL